MDKIMKLFGGCMMIIIPTLFIMGIAYLILGATSFWHQLYVIGTAFLVAIVTASLFIIVWKGILTILELLD